MRSFRLAIATDKRCYLDENISSRFIIKSTYFYGPFFSA
jgi:hypothetical protein